MPHMPAISMSPELYDDWSSRLESVETTVADFETAIGNIVAGAPVGSGESVFEGYINAANLVYGAIGDGDVARAAANRTAIQAAINAANTTGVCRVYVPPGTYYVARNGSNSYSLNFPGDGIAILGAGIGKTILKHPPGMPNTSVSIFAIDSRKRITISDVTLDGNWGNAVTQVATASHGVTLSGLGQTISVLSTDGFPSSGSVTVIVDQAGPGVTMAFTGKTSTTFTGCTGTGTLARGDLIGYIDIGNRAAIAGASSGVNIAAATTITLQSAPTAWAASGNACISFANGSTAVVSYGAIAGFQLTGVALVSGAGTMTTGDVVAEGTTSPGINHVAQHDPKNHGVFVRGSQFVTITNVECKNVYGDGIWIGPTGTPSADQGEARDVFLANVIVNIAGRNGFTFGGGCERIYLYACRSYWPATQDFDAEPQADFSTCRDIGIDRCWGQGWWNKSHPSRGTAVSLTCIGSVTNNPSQTNVARNWQITNSTFFGSCYFSSCSNVTFEGNTVLCNWTGKSLAPIYVTNLAENVTIRANWAYNRTLPEVVGGNGNHACVHVVYTSGKGHVPPRGIRVAGNWLYGRNGKGGVYVDSPGGQAYNIGASAVYQLGTSGVSTGITAGVAGVMGPPGVGRVPGLEDSSKAWATNQWTAYMVRRGTAHASIADNTATALRLGDPADIGFAGGFSQVMAWHSPHGDLVPTPSNGAYLIHQHTGMTVIEDNFFDGTDDGFGAGGKALSINNQVGGARVIARRNQSKNATGAAFYVDVAAVVGKKYKHLELVENVAWDDQLVATCTHVVQYETNFPALGAPDVWIMRGNVKGDGVAAHTTGLTSGAWLRNDGQWQEWEGFGLPSLTANNGSRFWRVDPATANEVLYVRAAGAWTAK